jgi:hypothetical protein
MGPWTADLPAGALREQIFADAGEGAGQVGGVLVEKADNFHQHDLFGAAPQTVASPYAADCVDEAPSPLFQLVSTNQGCRNFPWAAEVREERGHSAPSGRCGTGRPTHSSTDLAIGARIQNDSMLSLNHDTLVLFS